MKKIFIFDAAKLCLSYNRTTNIFLQYQLQILVLVETSIFTLFLGQLTLILVLNAGTV